MNAFRQYNIPTVTLDIRISCDTFWNYKYNIPIRINDYYNDNDNTYDNNTRNINNRHGGDDATDTCRIGNIGRSDPLFCRLEEYLVDYVITRIYDDLITTRRHRDIPILLRKARKFHIHGRTLEDILFPTNPGSSGNNIHAMPENIVYICTHC